MKYYYVTKYAREIGEIIYRVELPDMEQITLIYLENNDADYRKSQKQWMKIFSNANNSSKIHFYIFFILFIKNSFYIIIVNVCYIFFHPSWSIFV